MRRSDFNYHLPDDLIAQRPARDRSGSRLLDLGPSSAASTVDRHMVELPELLTPGDLLVFNDTRVIPARLVGRKPTGGRVEMLIERVTGPHDALTQVGASKTPKAGAVILVEEPGRADARLVVVGREGDLFHVRLETTGTVMELLERSGRLPLPPYIAHTPDDADRERYQTVFATEPGAVAAPTAGLHFDLALLDRVRGRGVRTASLTLHVGAGTFQPLRVEDLSLHTMHSERYRISADLIRDIELTRRQGRKVVAVGTTVARALESAARDDGVITQGAGETRLFIVPGYRFKVVDRMLTNFHLPQSTLLMLVCAFSGYEKVMKAYQHAVDQRYRFFSYGDAMLLSRLD